MSFKTFLTSIEADVESVFNHVSAEFHKLSAIEQQAQKEASTIVAVINKDLQATPDMVFTGVQAFIPGIDKAKLTTDLNSLETELGLPASQLFEDAVKALQTYFGTFKGSTWEQMVQAAVNILSLILAPGTIIQKLIATAEYVYQEFVKPKVKA